MRGWGAVAARRSACPWSTQLSWSGSTLRVKCLGANPNHLTFGQVTKLFRTSSFLICKKAGIASESCKNLKNT